MSMTTEKTETQGFFLFGLKIVTHLITQATLNENINKE